MDRPSALPFVLGEWLVDPSLNRMLRDGDAVKLEPRMMRLLVCFVDRAGAVVSADDLLDHAWPGVIVTPDSLYQGVAALRRVLGDNPKDPRYIVTVPRQGYRLIARVGVAPIPDEARAPVERAPDPTSAITMRRSIWRRIGVPGAIIGALAICAAVGLGAYRSLNTVQTPSLAGAAPQKSVAVLPFLDLTESMGEEVFADGMTEELIDKFSRIPGLRVPSPTASFWFKDKQMTIGEIARKLGVAYVLDGSVRKSDTTLRVAARLVHADDGYVVWSETYDRPIDDKLMVQDDIASQVGKAIATAIDPPAR